MMLKKLITLLVFSLSGCVAPYTAPESWTVRDDCHFRASQRNEDFDIHQFIAKIKKEENQEFGIVITPAGAASITNEIKQCHIELDSCKNGK
jgi:hypothetical protein